MVILVVEGEVDVADLLAFLLRRSGHDVLIAGDCQAALRLWEQYQPSLVLLDVDFPNRSGWEVLGAIRSRSTIPIMLLGTSDSEDDIVHGLDMGAEDYVTKPFSPRLLQARVKASLRRGQEQTASQVGHRMKVADIELDIDARTIKCGEVNARLTRIETGLLRELAARADRVLPHTELVFAVWGYTGEVSSSILKGHVRNIRFKLERVGSRCCLQTIAGVGYRLVASGDEEASH